MNYEEAKAEAIHCSQKSFDALIERFPHAVDTAYLIDKEMMEISFDKAIKDHSDLVDAALEGFSSKLYRKFPVVLGRPNDYLHSIMFENIDDAITFKLSLP